MQNDYPMTFDTNDVTQVVQYTPLPTINDSNEVTQVVQYTPLTTINDSTNKILAKILEEMHAQKQQISRLTEEVVTLRNEVRQLKSNYFEDIKTNLVPALPLTTVKQLEELNEQLQQNQDLVVQLKYIIGKVGGDCSNSFVRNAIKKILSDDVAAKLSWRGTNSKPRIQQYCIKQIITNVCHLKFPKADDAGMNKDLQQHFVHAADRLRKGNRTKKGDEI